MTVHEMIPAGVAADDAVLEGEPAWSEVCPVERITADTGVAALFGTEQVAVFRLADGRLFAVANRDPASGADVLARGIVGDSAGRPFVASPLYKQRFDLATGDCLDDPGLRLSTWPVRQVGGVVLVGSPRGLR